MNLLKLQSNLKGNQEIAFRQVLKCGKWSTFVDDVTNQTDLSAVQVRSAFNGLIKKGLIVNVTPHVCDMNQYKLAY